MQMRSPLTALVAILVLTTGCEQPNSSVAATQETAPDEQQAEASPGSGQPAAESPAAEPASAPTDIRDQVLVTINGAPVTGEMFGMYFNDRVQKSPGAKNSPQFQSQALNELINIRLLAQAATRAGLDSQPDVITALELQRDQLLSRLALQDYAAKHTPDEEALKKAYEERYLNQETEEYKARHILVKTEDEAKQLIDQIDEGADFGELAKQHSTGPTGKNGGDLGWFDATQMVAPFAEAIKTMEPGSSTKEPVQTQFGWHVILLEEKRAKQPPAFEAVRKNLLAEAQRQALGVYVNTLREDSEITINEALTQKGPPPVAPAPAE